MVTVSHSGDSLSSLFSPSNHEFMEQIQKTDLVIWITNTLNAYTLPYMFYASDMRPHSIWSAIWYHRSIDFCDIL